MTVSGAGVEAFDSAYFDLGGSEGVHLTRVGYRWSEERKSCDDAEDQRHCILRRRVIRSRLLREKLDRRRDRLSKSFHTSKVSLRNFCLKISNELGNPNRDMCENLRPIALEV